MVVDDEGPLPVVTSQLTLSIKKVRSLTASFLLYI